MYHIHAHILSQPHGSRADAQSTPMNMDSKSLILLLSPSEQEEGPWVTMYIHLRMNWVLPTGWFKPTACPASVPGSQSPQVLALALAHIVPQAITPLELRVQTIAHMHTHIELTRTPLSFTPGRWDRGFPWTALRGAQNTHAFPPATALLYSSELVQVGLWWAKGTCNGPWVGWARVLFGVPLLPLPLWSLVIVQTSF